MAKIPSLLEMLKAGVHFGHHTSKWHPKMEEYIYASRNGVHIFDLERTSEELVKTLEFVKTLAQNGKVILFVGTKQQAREIIKAAALECEMPYLVERWIGGLLTNFSEVQKRLKKYHELKDMFASGEIEKYAKKEQVMLKKKLENMDKYLCGLTDLEKMPDALYIADMRVEKTAITEAKRKGVEIIGVCDTNVNPANANQIIPANDDAVNSIKIMSNLVSEAIKEGNKLWQTKQAEMKMSVKVEPIKNKRKVVQIEES